MSLHRKTLEKDHTRSPKAYTHRRDKALKLGGPFLGFFIGIGILFLYYPWQTALTLFTLMIAYMVPPAGKETIIPFGILVWGLNWIVVSLVITFIDMIAALFLVWNFDYAKKIPLLGPWIRNFERDNANIMKEKKWLQGLTYIGLVFFVFVPLQGTESVGGSVLGRILGLRPWTVFSAILVGSITGSLATAYIAMSIGTALLSVLTTPLAKIITGVSLLGAFAVVSYFLWWYRKKKKAKKATQVMDEEE
jgi:uncharacterized membrane protein